MNILFLFADYESVMRFKALIDAVQHQKDIPIVSIQTLICTSCLPGREDNMTWKPTVRAINADIVFTTPIFQGEIERETRHVEIINGRTLPENILNDLKRFKDKIQSSTV